MSSRLVVVAAALSLVASIILTPAFAAEPAAGSRPALRASSSLAALPGVRGSSIDCLSGPPLPAASPAFVPPAPAAAPRPQLAEVRLTKGKYSGGPRISFPGEVVTAKAIRRMATGQVSSTPNRCARTVREALGWGLGDAHQWMQLPDRGFKQRMKNEGAASGDIVVWPFTFGSRRSQHIGIAVQTDNGMRLLSNLSGSLCLSALAPGYAAFYKPLPEPEVTVPAEVITAEVPQTPSAYHAEW